MKPYVITLSRQFASMGRAIAQSMSGELGINFYDRDIVEETAKRLGLSVSYVSKVEETGASFFTNLRYPLGMGLISTQKETFEIQSNIIRDLAQKESCIIVGRCADSVLREYAFITALPAGAVLAAQGQPPEAMPPAAAGEQVLVQGIADILLIFPDHLELLDYKTDRGKREADFLAAYRPQLNLYALAIEKRFAPKKVTYKGIFSLELGKLIDAG